MTETIEFEVGTDEITIEVGAVSNSKAFVDSGVAFPLNGVGGNAYLKFNPTTKKVEVWVEGELSGTFSKPSKGGDPF